MFLFANVSRLFLFSLVSGGIAFPVGFFCFDQIQNILVLFHHLLIDIHFFNDLYHQLCNIYFWDRTHNHYHAFCLELDILRIWWYGPDLLLVFGFPLRYSILLTIAILPVLRWHDLIEQTQFIQNRSELFFLLIMISLESTLFQLQTI